MDINKVFRPFKKKILFESILNAFLFAATGFFFAIFLTSLVYHILVKETPLVSTCMIGGIVFVVAFLIWFILSYPNKKRVAARLDAMGLQERASTMLALEGEATEIARLQREDAIAQINKISPKSLKMRVAKQSIIACGISIFMAAGILLLPYNVFAARAEKDLEQEEREQIVKDLIEELREEVKEAALDKEVKDDLEEMIEELEEELKNTENELEQIAKIMETKEKIEKLLEESSKEEEENQDSKEEEEDKENEEQQGERPPNEQDSQGNNGERPPEGPGEGNTMTEGIYDPVLGNVPYGKVFAAYYAKYLKALEEGTVPKDLQDIMDKYFSSLN